MGSNIIAESKGRLKEAIFRLRRQSAIKVFSNSGIWGLYAEELKTSGIIKDIYDKQRSFDELTNGQSVRGIDVDFGGLGENESLDLYSLIRHLKPNLMIETGVCNGVSSYIILEAMRVNGHGQLVSIDLPEVAGTEANEFWEGKGGAAIPDGNIPGWIVPASLRDNWDLRLGSSQDLLPSLMNEIDSFDIFLHDSEHSYECMTFEYEQAWSKLNSDGVLLSDDVGWNRAFKDFNSSRGLKPFYFSIHLGGAKKS